MTFVCLWLLVEWTDDILLFTWKQMLNLKFLHLLPNQNWNKKMINGPTYWLSSKSFASAWLLYLSSNFFGQDLLLCVLVPNWLHLELGEKACSSPSISSKLGMQEKVARCFHFFSVVFCWYMLHKNMVFWINVKVEFTGLGTSRVCKSG